MASVSDYNRVIKVLAGAREKIDPSMSVQKLQVLFTVAANPGITQTGISGLTGLDKGTVSKAAADLSSFTSKKVDGPGIIEQNIDRMNLATRPYSLTKKGEKIMNEIMAAAFGR